MLSSLPCIPLHECLNVNLKHHSASIFHIWQERLFVSGTVPQLRKTCPHDNKLCCLLAVHFIYSYWPEAVTLSYDREKLLPAQGTFVYAGRPGVVDRLNIHRLSMPMHCQISSSIFESCTIDLRHAWASFTSHGKHRLFHHPDANDCISATSFPDRLETHAISQWPILATV